MKTADELKEEIREAIYNHVINNPDYRGIPGSAIVFPGTLSAMVEYVEPLYAQIEELKILAGLKK
jgi:hypothetical protein